MKKHLFFAALAAVGMASCSDHEVAVDGNAKDRVEIKLGMGSMASVDTKGTGTVGSMDEATNEWNNERIQVIMTTIVDEESAEGEEWGFAKYGNNNLDPLFNGTVTYPTEAQGAGLTMTDESGKEVTYKSYVLSYWRAPYKEYIKYYPVSGRNDFFGYHLGGATTAAVAGKDAVVGALAGTNLCLTEATDTKAAYMSTMVTIDGSNDLMAGKAVKGDDNGREGFTAKLARENGKQPILDMKHLLTRFTFAVVEDATKATDNNGDVYMTTKGGKVDFIKMKTLSTAEMVVAYNDYAENNVLNLLTWDEASEQEVTLMNALATPVVDGERQELNEVATITFTGVEDEDGLAIGDALFVQPNNTAKTVTEDGIEKQYVDMTIKITVPADKFDGNGNRFEGESVSQQTSLIVKAPKSTNYKFLPGYSYHVKVKIHGLSEITVSAVLEAWKDGGEINVDVEEE